MVTMCELHITGLYDGVADKNSPARVYSHPFPPQQKVKVVHMWLLVCALNCNCGCSPVVVHILAKALCLSCAIFEALKVIKHFPKNVEGCRDGSAKNHRN